MQRPLRSGSRAQLLNPLRISHPKIDKLACQVAERRESVRKQLRIVFPWAWPSRSETRVRIYSPKAKYLFMMRTVYIFRIWCNSVHHIYAETLEKSLLWCVLYTFLFGFRPNAIIVYHIKTKKARV